MDWTVDLAACTAIHRPSGLVVRFRRAKDGGWDGEPVAPLPAILTAEAGARLMREAGDAYLAALKRRH